MSAESEPQPAARPTPRGAPELRRVETVITPEERPTPFGNIWVGVADYADVHRHGRTHVAAARGWDTAGLATLCREPAARALAPEGWAFLDVESTGLGAHAGIHAFLIGIGWLVPGGLRIEQFLLRDPSEEPALLHAVGTRLAPFAGLVTFNGKSFDMPLLATRAALLRAAPLAPGRTHCDLLHAARRAWGDGPQGCRLGDLEARLLGFRRSGDLPGRFIPHTYMQYLRDGRGADLDPILTHNRADLVSLALLTAAASRFLAAVESEVEIPSRTASHAADQLRAARLYAQVGEREHASRLLERCLAAAPPLDTRQAARGLYARLCKQAGDFERACGLWSQMTDDDPSLVEPVEELAKVDEHRRRDPRAALAWVAQRLGGPSLDVGSRRDLQYRQARLARRLAGGLLDPDVPGEACEGPLSRGSGIANLRSPI